MTFFTYSLSAFYWAPNWDLFTKPDSHPISSSWGLGIWRLKGHRNYLTGVFSNPSESTHTVTATISLTSVKPSCDLGQVPQLLQKLVLPFIKPDAETKKGPQGVDWVCRGHCYWSPDSSGKLGCPAPASAPPMMPRSLPKPLKVEVTKVFKSGLYKPAGNYVTYWAQE